MNCPRCKSTDRWTIFAGLNAIHQNGLSLQCDGPAKGDYCGFSIHLTHEQLLKGVFFSACAPDCPKWEGDHRPGCPNERPAEPAKACTCDQPLSVAGPWALCFGCSKRICPGCAEWFDNDMKCTGECHECAALSAAVGA